MQGRGRNFLQVHYFCRLGLLQHVLQVVPAWWHLAQWAIIRKVQDKDSMPAAVEGKSLWVPPSWCTAELAGRKYCFSTSFHEYYRIGVLRRLSQENWSGLLQQWLQVDLVCHALALSRDIWHYFLHFALWKIGFPGVGYVAFKLWESFKKISRSQMLLHTFHNAVGACNCLRRACWRPSGGVDYHCKLMLFVNLLGHAPHKIYTISGRAIKGRQANFWRWNFSIVFKEYIGNFVASLVQL